MQQPDSDQMDELLDDIDQEMQQEEVELEGMDEESDESSDSDESVESSDSDELEEPHPPPLQQPEAIVDAVRAYLPPMPSASLIADRPMIQSTPCDRRAAWNILPPEALDNIYMHLPISDIHVMGSVFDANLDAGWAQQWIEEDLILHDRQIHHGTYKDIRNYIRMHGGVVHTLRIDKMIFTPRNVRSWCRQLRKPEVRGPSELVLLNRGCPSMPLRLEPIPEEFLLPFNGYGLKKLHLCFFTLPQGGLHVYSALAGICELGLHGCAYDDEDLASTIAAWSQLERLTLSYASQTMLRVISHSMCQLKLCNSSIRILDLRKALALVHLSDLDLDSTALKIDHLFIRSLTILDVAINYTALPDHSQILMLQVLLNCFPCVRDLTIKRKDNVTEGQMLQGDNCPYSLFADMECLTSHLKVLTFSDFRGGKWELTLIKALASVAGMLSVLNVVCHGSCSQATRAEAATVLEETYYMSLGVVVSIF